MRKERRISIYFLEFLIFYFCFSSFVSIVLSCHLVTFSYTNLIGLGTSFTVRDGATVTKKEKFTGHPQELIRD